MQSGRRGDQQWSGYGGDWPAEETRRPVRKGLWIAAGVALAVIATGIGAAMGSRDRPDAPQWQSAEEVAAAAPVLAVLGGDAPQPSNSALAAMLDPLFTDPRLGGHVTASVIDVSTGKQLYDRDGGGPATPASTAKLLTAAAVLQSRGPAYRIPTKAVAGPNPGEVVLVGGGDPTLGADVNTTYPDAARLDVLAGDVLKSLGGQAPTKVIVDSSAFTGLTASKDWFPEDVTSGYVSNITALMTDGARKDPRRKDQHTLRYPKPDMAAGQSFAKALGLPVSAVSTGSALAGAQQLGEVLSPPISRLVEMMLSDSDNVIAEGMARQVAMARDKPASFDGGRDATVQVLGELGISTQSFGLVDGSGLSNVDKVSTNLLTAVLAKAASPDHPQLRAILSGLPVAAYSGTLAQRYTNAAAGGSAAGTVRAKTGTLTTVDSLAGLAVDTNGRLLAFAIVADETAGNPPAEAALDKIGAAIASCGCA